MTDDRKPVFQRLAALAAGPFLLGREAIARVWAAASGPPEAPPAPARLPIAPPPHAIKRRG